MRRWPVVPTILVGLAVAAMIGLGVWQLARRHEKEAAIARLAANIHLPPVAFPRLGGAAVDPVLFRRSSLMCVRVIGWRRESGRSASGTRGWRVIAECATGAEGPGIAVQLGVARAPDATPAWRGGLVEGHVTAAPSHRALLSRLFRREATQPMLVADRPPAGLEANPGPDLSAVPNNHLAYAVQWFLFAGIAILIYAIALRRRQAAPS